MIMNILFLSLEFQAQTFSGNGIAAQSQAKALAGVGQHVMVVSASPNITSVTRREQAGAFLEHNSSGGSFQLIEVPVTSWGRLDSSAPWEEYLRGVTSHMVVQAVKEFNPDVAMVVDWSAMSAWDRLHDALADDYGVDVPYVWLNYRVFSRTETGQGLELVSRLEAQAMAGATCTIVLSRSDQQYLTQHNQPPTVVKDEAPAGPAHSGNVHVLLCALRGDMKRIPLLTEDSSSDNRSYVISNSSTGHDRVDGTTGVASVPDGYGAVPVPDGTALSDHEVNGTSPLMMGSIAPRHTGHTRPYLTCVVRLAPEKEPQQYVALVEALEKRGTLKRHALVPLMIGSSNDEFAQGLKSTLRASVPESVILEEFMGPEDLAKVYSQTRINVHPATYDAFGMTVVEAASQGCPSVVHDGNGAVGATDLLRASKGEVVLVDMQQGIEHLAEQVEAVLDKPGWLEKVGMQAAARARSWDEATHANELIRMTAEAITGWRARAKGKGVSGQGMSR